MPNNTYTIILLLLLSCVVFMSTGSAYEMETDTGTYDPDTYSPDTYRPVEPAPVTYGGQIGRKLGGGLSNITMGWLEIPKSVINTGNKVNWAFAATGGMGLGLLNTIGRALTGLVDVVTFPLPTKPMPSPYFVWDDFDRTTTYGPAFRLYE